MRERSELCGRTRTGIGIARPMALNPDFIVGDEPVWALDVSIQSQILNLLNDLQEERKIAYLFIAHNLAVVKHFSDEVAVEFPLPTREEARPQEFRKQTQTPPHPATLFVLPLPHPPAHDDPLLPQKR